MLRKLANELHTFSSVQRYYPAGTPVKILTEPASGGYMFAQVTANDGRNYLISIRESDLVEEA